MNSYPSGIKGKRRKAFFMSCKVFRRYIASLKFDDYYDYLYWFCRAYPRHRFYTYGPKKDVFSKYIGSDFSRKRAPLAASK